MQKSPQNPSQKVLVSAIQHSFKGSYKATQDFLAQEICKIADNAKNAKIDSSKHHSHQKIPHIIALQELHSNHYFCQSENVDIFDLAESFDDEVAFFSALARQNEVIIITSLFEKRAKGLYHNTAVVFEKDGQIAGKYRKMHIPDDPSFYEKFYFTQGDLGFEPIKTSAGRVGVLVCWDQWYPEAARIMALKGADMLFYPTAIGYTPSDDAQEKARQLGAWQMIQRAHSIANALPTIAINRVGFEPDTSGVGEGIEFWGHSFISGAQGEILAELDDKEGILECEVDLSRTQDVRRIWPFLRDRRIDAYKPILKRFCD
ncbi:carbon-nitrogen hydrolase [Helicobacter sp. T3_23-1056]